MTADMQMDGERRQSSIVNRQSSIGMELEIRYGDQVIPVEIRGGEKKGTVFVSGREVSCDCVRLPDGRYSILMDGRVFDMTTELSGEACLVTGNAGTFQLRILDPRGLAPLRAVEVGPPGLQRLVAEMPGKVLRVLVKPGDTVAYDQGLLVIEAMKMQNEIRAPKSGVVKEIAVAEGRAVSSGDFLLSLE
jgi:acetyl/propionyl-CoA carboxylase alpha subunit